MDRPGHRNRAVWQAAPRRVPNAFEAYSLLFWTGALLYLPSALGRRGVAEPAFIGPFKGGTRAIGCLWHGDVWMALRFNPLAVALLALITLGLLRWMVVLVLGKRPALDLNGRGNLVLAAAALLCVAANWVYVLTSESWRMTYPY